MANELHILIDVDGAGKAVQELKQVDTAIEGVTQTSAKAGGAMSDFEREVRKAIDADVQLATATTQAKESLGSLRGSLNSVAEGAGITFENLGVLNSALLAIGVFEGMYALTRWALEFVGVSEQLDTAVANTTAKLLHLGDVQAQTAGAQQDVIDLAIARHADAHIKYADALKWNADWFVKWQHQAKEMDDVAARIHAPQELADQLKKWHAEIDAVRAAGALPALIAGIDTHVISVKELSASYRISEGAINLFKQELADEAKGHATAAAEAKKHEAELDRLYDKVRQIEAANDAFTLAGFEKINQASAVANAARVRDTLAGYASITKAEAALADDIAKSTLSSSDYQIKKIWDVAHAQEQAFVGSLEQRAQFNAAVEALANRQADVIIAAAQRAELAALTLAIGGTGGFNTGDTVNAPHVSGVSGSTGPGPITVFGMPHMAAGGPVLRDGPIFAHAGEYVLPKSRAGGAGDASVTVNVMVSGVFDPAATRSLARVVKDVFNQELRQGRLLPAN